LILDDSRVAFQRQVRQEEAAVAIEHLQIPVGVRDDLAQEPINMHVAGELFAKRLA
jgi:hypothetical protein